MRRLLALLAVLLPGVARAQAPAPAPAAPAASAPAAAAEPESVKHDQGVVTSVDAQSGRLVCTLPDGQVTYQVSGAQLLDAEGKPQGAAPGSLKAGDKVRITYEIIASGAERGAKASVVRILK